MRVNYSAIGSGAGIRQFTSGLVRFGASDAGMSKKEIAKLPARYGGVLILPMTAGCIVLSYNLQGVEQPVRLSRRAYVQIPDDLQIKVPDPSGNGAYPMATYTWMLVGKHYDENKDASTLKELLRFAFEDRQQEIAGQLGYMRMPDEVVRRLRTEIDGVAAENGRT